MSNHIEILKSKISDNPSLDKLDLLKQAILDVYNQP